MLEFEDEMTSYEKLKKKMQLGAHIAHIKRVLEWDRAISMPKGAALSRSKDMAFLAAMSQEGFANAEVGKWIQEVDPSTLEEWDRRNYDKIVERYHYSRLITSEMARDRAEKKERCFSEYQIARENNDWNHVRPYFEKSFDAYLDCAKHASDQLGVSPYDYQLMRYSQKNTVALIDPLFNLLKSEIPALINTIVDAQKEIPVLPIQVLYEQQHAVAEKVIEAMGYDFHYGYMTRSTSAFSSGWRRDARIATRYEPGSLKTIFSAIHEAGHAIYKQNLPAEWEGQLIGSDMDKMLHESQSLFFEKQIGFSASGLRFIHGLLSKEDPIFGRAYRPDEFVTRMRRVTPGLVRIHADEVTYPMHIVMRYEIERDLFAETIKVADVPEVWRAKTKEYLGLDVVDDLSGCLQDRHWFRGKFGYFPIYAQGAVYAAQLSNAIYREYPDMDKKIEDGNIRPITRWLSDNIHCWGQFYNAHELLERATGSPPDSQFLLRHLKRRYLDQ